MITSQKNGLQNLPLFFFSFVISKWIYDHFLISYAHYIANYGMSFALRLNIIITFILTYFTFIFLKFCQTQQIRNTSIMICYLIYILMLIYVIFLKDIGAQGLSLNPLSFITEIANGSKFVPVMNLLMFIPLGLLFPLSKTNLSFSLLGLLLIESCQYMFHLGILDLGDVTLNLLSIAIGNTLHFQLQKWIKNYRSN
ncbi:VanZ family protein [Streptococcus mutans]|jgi:hypothetical protein|uniref:VanZ family protein n=1 Tax=Streptococcus mutans TaxID=1309 RepID=UPI0002B5DBF1|nr:VanZ family protein [Streptococcus mutans]AMF86128.1 antibiotic resistance protein VanZ [Streptococcus mutans]EMC11506.1 hypothetical protein SMU75_05164 [Streptococcus mutans N3209]MCB5053278.1 VanZ family protein [Streptococcus mutans]MCY7119233.1 VanZ family protein [Streptococcus mutans]MDP5874232.1 VanZ family protein [Streptococcus mutans]